MSQIGNVTNIEQLDELDRQELDPRIKLQLLAAEAKTAFGVDPRGASRRFVIVGRPRAILQLLLDFKGGLLASEIRMHTTTVYGVEGADVVGFWQDVAIVCRSQVKDDNIYLMPSDQVVPSLPVDRQRAAAIRIAENAGNLAALKDGGE